MKVDEEWAVKRQMKYISSQIKALKSQRDTLNNLFLEHKPKDHWIIYDAIKKIDEPLSRLERRLYFFKNKDKVADKMIDVDFLKESVDVEMIIGRKPDYVSVGKRYYKCPLHNEKTASFCWNNDDNYFYCFGCGKGGDIINLYMWINDCNFKEAIKDLANLS